MARDQAMSLGLSLVLGTIVFLLGTCMVQAFVRAPPPPLIMEAGCQQASVIDLEGTNIEGRANLCPLDDGISLAMEAEHLVVGHTYTVWLGYFDLPVNCQWNPCGLGDVLGDDPVGVLGRMDGRVADRSTETFWGDFHGLRFSRGSQVILFLLSHGNVSDEDNRYRARQLLTPRLPDVGAPVAATVPGGAISSAAARAVFNIR